MGHRMLKGYTFAILSAIIYGLMPLMAKHIYADGVNALTLVFLRNLLALPSLGLLVLVRHRSFRIRVKSLPRISVLAFLGCCITPILLFSSYNYIPTGTATVFHFVYPSLVVLMGVIFLKKKIPLGTWISVGLCFVGICLFFDPAAPFRPEGSLLSLASALTFAVYVTVLSLKDPGGVTGILLSFYIALISTVITFVICIATNSIALPQSPRGWLLCAVFAFMVTTVAVVFFQQGAFLIGGEKTAILNALEPITGIIVGIAVFHEPITPGVTLGSLLVIGASILIVICDIKKTR